MGQEWKRRLRAWRTRGWLKADAPLAAKAVARLEQLDETELAAAALNPGHSEAGRAAARALLESRGGRLEAADVVVPGFVKPQPMGGLLSNCLFQYVIHFLCCVKNVLMGVLCGFGEKRGVKNHVKMTIFSPLNTYKNHGYIKLSGNFRNCCCRHRPAVKKLEFCPVIHFLVV